MASSIEEDVITVENRRVYRATERGETDIPLAAMMMPNGDLDIYEDVQAKQYFNFSLRKDKIFILAGNHIGLIPLNNKVALLVEPKIARQNWLHIVGIAEAYLRDINYLSYYSRVDTTSSSIVEFLSRALIKQLEPLIQKGIFRQYKSEKYVTSFPNGRILIGESIKHVWPYGHQNSVVVEQYYFTKDNAYNRLLKYALHLAVRNISNLLGNSSRMSLEIKREVTDLYLIINELDNLLLKIPVDPKVDRYLPDVVNSLVRNSFPETRDYYINACKTALLLVDNSGLLPTVEEKRKTDTVLSFIINMEDIFEAYCRNILHSSIQTHNWLRVINGKDDKKKLFSGIGADNRQAEPDIVIEIGNGEKYPIEVKYKDNLSRDNINQAITYALAYQKRSAILVCYADVDQNSGWKYLGNVGGQIDVWIYRINLESKNIEQEEKNFTIAVNDKIRQL